jgi:RNA polymerase sigma-70 factor (ECF subfamily)
MHLDRLPDALAASRDPAFPDLVRALQDDVYSGALRMLGSPADAEDVTQEAFVRAYEALGTYDAERIRTLRLRGWVWTIAANLCRNRARSRRRRPEAPLEAAGSPAAPDPGPEASAIDAAGLDQVAVALRDLPWQMRSAVVLRHVVDLDYPDIAEALDRPVGTVKSDVHRGLNRLRAVLDPGATP